MEIYTIQSAQQNSSRRKFGLLAIAVAFDFMLRNTFKYEPGASYSDPCFVSQTQEMNCPHCRQLVRFLVNPDKVEWEKVADDYQEMLREVDQRHSKILDDLEAMYGTGNPVSSYYRNRLNQMKSEIKRLIAEWGRP